MKTKLTLIIALLITLTTFAQQGINYKALIKDASGNVLVNTPVRILFNIQEELLPDNIVYSEDHQITTDVNGIVILNIGNGNPDPLFDLFSEIEWPYIDYYLNVQVDITGGTNYVDMGTTQFMAVPYAKHANTATTASNVTGLEAIDEGNGIGWRLKGQDTNYYGNIGFNATDLSFSNTASTTRGATGGSSTAMGSFTTASESYSTAMGRLTTASGLASTAMGESTTASESYSTAMGSFTTASESYSTAMGKLTTASGFASTAMGESTTASESYSTAMGTNTTASKYASTAMGESTTASGDASTAMGESTIASGAASTAMGLETTALGSVSTAMGDGSNASGAYSTAMGDATTASGEGSTAIGRKTIAEANASTAIGSYNVGGGSPITWVATDPLFEIGNGQFGARSNALTVLKNGNTAINGVLTVNESTFSSAVNAIKTHIGNSDSVGVYGENTVSDFYGIGVEGVGGWKGVQGIVSGTGGSAYYGVSGRSYGNNSGTNYGVYGTASSGSTNYAMYASGNMTVTGTFVNPSDRKLKTNIKTMAKVMPSILKLKPKTYKIANEFVKKMNMPTGLQNGFIAQELKDVFPELVSNNIHPGETKDAQPIEYLGINYNGIIPVLVKAIQEQQETIESLQSTVNSQKEDYTALLKRIVQLEKNK